MRVIAGELGGRRLVSPAGAAVRPTADRTREALFSILGSVEGARVLDLFCGTGALAIEALSRGAASALLVDTDTASAAANVEALNLADRAELVRCDAVAHLGRDQGRYDLILCDPPYTLARGLAPELEQALPRRLAPGGRLVLESGSRDPLPFDPGTDLELETDRRYGAASLRVWRAA